MSHRYVHGYSETEACRLDDQAATLAEILHHDTLYPEGELVLEAGCGTGAQTEIVAGKNPKTRFHSMDISESSLEIARQRIAQLGYQNVTFEQGNIFELPYPDHHFDHIFVCFVLEHLPNPQEALQHLKRVLKPGGTITTIEGDHESTYFYPRSKTAWKTIKCLIRSQEMMGGNSLIGRELYPLLVNAGFENVWVTPRVVYADHSRPQMVDGFTLKTFIAMVEGVKDFALKEGMMSESEWDEGITDMKKAAGPDGTFNYTFFKGVGVKK